MARVIYPSFELWVIHLLKAKARKEGKVKFTTQEIRQGPDLPPFRMIEILFITADNALRKAGLYPYEPTREDLIRSLQDFYHKYKRSPTQQDADRGLLPYSHKTYTREFSSWTKALMAANLDIFGIPKSGDPDGTIREYMIARIIKEIQQMFGNTGILPPMQEYDRITTHYKSETCRAYIGNWQQVASATNLKLSSQTLRYSNRRSSTYYDETISSEAEPVSAIVEPTTQYSRAAL